MHVRRVRTEVVHFEGSEHGHELSAPTPAPTPPFMGTNEIVGLVFGVPERVFRYTLTHASHSQNHMQGLTKEWSI